MIKSVEDFASNLITNTKISKELIDGAVWVTVKCPICKEEVSFNENELDSPLNTSFILSTHMYSHLLSNPTEYDLSPAEMHQVAGEWSSWCVKEIKYLLDPSKRLCDALKKIADEIIEKRAKSVVIVVDYSDEEITGIRYEFNVGVCNCGSFAEICNKCSNKIQEKLSNLKTTLENILKSL